MRIATSASRHAAARWLRSSRVLRAVRRPRPFVVDAARQVAAHQRSMLALDLQPAVVHLDEAVDEGEAEPRSRALARAALGGEALEDVGLHLGRDAGARVGDGDL